MSDYIYRPPPPPPTAAGSPIPTPGRGGYNNGQRGTFRGGRSGRGRGGGRVSGGSGDKGRGRGRGRGNSDSQLFAQRGNSHGYVQQPQRIPHPLPQCSPQTHFNPAFLTQQYQALPSQFPLTPLQPYPNQFFTPPTTSIYNLPGFSSQTPPTPPLPRQPQPPQTPTKPNNSYLSYSEEQYIIQNPQEPQSQQLEGSLPTMLQSDSYTNATSGWPTHSSYGYFELPEAPKQMPPKKHRDEKPDMDEETWLGLNGGKLLGTDIAPPDTPEEIKAWIKERKTRFPTAKKIAEDQAKKEAENGARGKAREKARETAQETAPHSFKKRKHPVNTNQSFPLNGPDVATNSNLDSSDQDSGDEAPPETVSVKTKSTLPDAPTTGRKYEPKPKKLASVCKIFAARGKCHRGTGCKFRHEIGEGPKREEKKIEDDGKKSLYQRLVEHDREKENALMLQVIKYLIDKGKLQEEPKAPGA